MCFDLRRSAAPLLAVTLLCGCGQTAPQTGATPETAAPAPTATVTTAPTERPAEASAPAPEPTPEENVIRLEDVAGLWELTAFETEGYADTAEAAGISGWIILREEGTADYIERSEYGEWQEYDYCIVDDTGRGTLGFGYESEAAAVSLEIVAVRDGEMEISAAWTGPDGTPGGSEWFYRLVEREGEGFRGRQMTDEELTALTASLDYADNGFFLSTYDRPEEIDWNEVCYCGAGISAHLSDAARAAYEARYGEIFTDLEAIYTADLEDLAWDKTQTPYAVARRPVSLAGWDYLDDFDLWVFQHGDTNMQTISFTDGWRNGSMYELYYQRYDYETWTSERPFVMHAYIRDGEWQYVSNLPADAPAPVTLLNIEFFETREDAARLCGATEFVEVTPKPYDEPYGWRWAVVTAMEDGVRYIVDRGEESVSYDLYGVRVPGANLASGVLNAGECFAIYVNQPWHPDIRVMATKDAYWGEYYFGEDNWLHFDDAVIRYVTGHDLDGEGRGCDPQNEAQLARFLMDGTWAWFDGTGAFRAAVSFDSYRQVSIMTLDESYPIFLSYAQTYTGAGEAPDTLVLERGDYFYSEWTPLPDWYTWDALGDYLVSAAQMDGEQILYLTQVNNGDGALGYLLPGAEENATSFMLFRYRGTAVFEPQG